MELMAVISALKFFDSNKTSDTKYKIEIYTDSQYLANALNKGWLNSWQKNGWKTSNKQPVKNQDLWQQLIPLLEKYDIVFNWVRGHSGNIFNEQVDQMANNAAKNQSPVYHEVINLDKNSNPKIQITKSKITKNNTTVKLNKTSKTLTIKQQANNPNEMPHTIVINKDNFDQIFSELIKLKELLNK
jgi:Ribonuclease HI